MSVEDNIIGTDYFATMGIPIIKGRGIEARDDSTAQKVLVINQHFADHFWPGQDPLGRTVRMGGSDHIVIGVVPTGKYQRLGEAPMSYMYLSQGQHFAAGRWIQVRTAGDPTSFMPTLRAEVAAIDEQMPLSDVRTMEAQLGVALLPSRLTGAVLGIFGALGLGLAAIALYGSGGFDVVTFVAVPVVLIGVAALAIWIPSRKASGPLRL